MNDVEERFARFDDRLEEHTIMLGELRSEMTALAGRVGGLEQRMENRFERLEGRLDRIDDKMTRLFMWQVGLQVTTLTAIVVALVAR